jgi:pyridoxal phosphate enzyme (YggS family)
MSNESRLLPDRVIANLRRVRGEIASAAERSGRPPDSVTLIAATKTVPAEIIQAVYAHGVTICGENRVQEARAKARLLTATAPLLHWEMIGSLQRNKVNASVDLFQRIHSIDSIDLAQALDRATAERNTVMPVLIEVNAASERSKHGVTAEAALDLARAIAGMSHVRGEGFMTIAPAGGDLATLHSVFRRLRALRDAALVELGPAWRELSMGMSDDFAIAIEEGATLVRIGRAIFGERPPVG